MKISRWIVTGLMLAASALPAHAYERAGVLGLNYTVGPSFVVGGTGATDVSSVEPGVGAALQLGLTRNVDFVFAYDYMDADLRTQALTFGGQWRFAPERSLCPFAGAGIGFGKPVSGEGWDHLALKLSAGIEKALTDDIGLAGVFSYEYVEGPDPFGSVHVIVPGIRLTYYFASILKR